MNNTKLFTRITGCILASLLSGCSAVVPLSSDTNDSKAKTFATVPNMSNIYVIRTCEYGGKLHDVIVDGGGRISLSCHNYTLLSVKPGQHKLSAFSTENKESLTLNTNENSNYFVKMGWSMGSGSGDVHVTLKMFDTSEGMQAVKDARLVSADEN